MKKYKRVFKESMTEFEKLLTGSMDTIAKKYAAKNSKRYQKMAEDFYEVQILSFGLNEVHIDILRTGVSGKYRVEAFASYKAIVITKDGDKDVMEVEVDLLNDILETGE